MYHTAMARVALVFWAACLLAGCSEPTAILLRIDGAGSEPALHVPTDVDELQVSVSGASQPAVSQEFALSGAVRPLAESLVLLPGSAAAGQIHIDCDGQNDEDFDLNTSLHEWPPSVPEASS